MILRVALLVALAAACVPVPSLAGEPAPPFAVAGAPLAGDAAAASVLRPATLRAVFRVPRTGSGLFVATPWYVRDLSLRIVGPGPRRQTLVADTDLPGRMLGLRLPDDAWTADRVELTATVVNSAAPPYLLGGDQLARIGWRNGWYQIFFGLFAAFALVFGILAPALRARAFGWYALALTGQAGLLIPWLGVVRPPPAVSQPLHAALQSLVLAALALFTLVYFRRAALPRAVTLALLTLVGANAAVITGADVLQDLWSLPDALTQALLATVYLAYAAVAVAGARRRVEGAGYVVAATALAAAGIIAANFPGANDAVTAALQLAPLAANAVAAVLIALAISSQLRRPPQTAVNTAAARPQLAAPLHVDGLTGIPNRAALDAARAAAWDRARRARAPLAALLIDIDHFKVYNDTYGHHAGDDVLRRIAAALAATAPHGDQLAGRYGGEEFLMLVPGTDAAAAQRTALAVLDAVAALNIAHGGAPSKRLTVSIGAAASTPSAEASEATADPDGSALIRRAADALYLAKTMVETAWWLTNRSRPHSR